MPEDSPKSPLKVQFDKDKAFLLAQTEEYLNTKPGGDRVGEALTADRNEVNDDVKAGRFTEALQKLEILREQKTGIALTKIKGPEGTTPVIIRDAREAKNPRVLGTEAFEMQYLNALRGAIDIAKIEEKPELEAELKKQAVDFIETFNKDNEGKTQEEISINVKNKINNVAKFLEKEGIKDVHTKLNVAKDFQNFNDEHCNIVTVSKVKDKNGKDRTAIEAEVALKGLTEEQKAEYQNRADKKWFTKMPVWERKLVNKYAEKIKEGNHVISTQLRQIVGMKNAFEKITADFNDNSEFKILAESKHAGTLCSVSRDKNSQQNITDQNLRQAQEWMGNVHANTLNSGFARFILPHIDAKFVAMTKRAVDHVGGLYTNTAFNKFRRIASFSHFDGAKEQLNVLANNLTKEEGNFKDIATHLRPRSKLDKLLGTNKPKGVLDTMLYEEIQAGRLTKEAAQILSDAADLKKDIEKADVALYRTGDDENISSSISTKLNSLCTALKKSKEPIFKDIPKYETLTMCASGKDRTGAKLTIESGDALAAEYGISKEQAYEQIGLGGHTANQAGSPTTGGASIGCFGTLKVTMQGFPKLLKKFLQTMIEPSAANNKIKKLKEGQIIDENAEQRKAEETPDMLQTESYRTQKEPYETSIQVGTSQNKLKEKTPELNQNQVVNLVQQPSLNVDQKNKTSEHKVDNKLVKEVQKNSSTQLQSSSKNPGAPSSPVSTISQRSRKNHGSGFTPS